jgi:hypothetical protein
MDMEWEFGKKTMAEWPRCALALWSTTTLNVALSELARFRISTPKAKKKGLSNTLISAGPNLAASNVEPQRRGNNATNKNPTILAIPKLFCSENSHHLSLHPGPCPGQRLEHCHGKEWSAHSADDKFREGRRL